MGYEKNRELMLELNRKKKGKTYEEIYGLERAKTERIKRGKSISKHHKDYYKIHFAWNKGLNKESDHRVLKNANNKIGIKRPDVSLKNSNPLFIKKVIESRIKRPTSYEKKISELCIDNNLPFLYVGNGTFIIGHKNPDFVDKENKIAVEVYYDYYKIRDFGSCEEYEKQRREYFSKYGYKTIFIRTNEINSTSWKQICLDKLKGGKNYA